MYWVAVHDRWALDANFRQIAAVYFKPVPWPVRGLVGRLVRRHILKSLKAQGMGRHNQSEIQALAERGMASLSALLGEQPYLMGGQPCSADAMLFAMVSGALCPQFKSTLWHITTQHANLVAYEARIREQFFSVALDNRI